MEVVPVKECMICAENKPIIEIASTLKCWADEECHTICIECMGRENDRRKNNGFNTPNECIICKPLQERIEPLVIQINDVVTLHVNNDRGNISNNTLTNRRLNFWIICLLLVLWIIGVISWNISVVVWNLCHGEKLANQEFILVVNIIHIIGGLTLTIILAMILSIPGIICLECRKN